MVRCSVFVYGSVLDALGPGLYPKKRHVLREFVQNACDAVHDYEEYSGEPQEDPIEIRFQPPSITIFDRGMGMERKRMRQYRYVDVTVTSKPWTMPAECS
jgi:HSP90 family molecular chaperone